MKNLIKSIIFIWIAGLLFFSCKKEEIKNFSGQDVAYFKFAKEGGKLSGSTISKTDSIAVNFAFDEEKVRDTVLKIPIKIQGYTSSTARVVNLSIMKESTAKQGVDFKIPKKIEIPPNSVRTYVPIRIYRTPGIKKKVVSINLALLPNKNFKTNLVGTGTTGYVKYNQFKISVSDILSRPSRWPGYFMGPFSIKKIRLLAELTGLKLSFYNLINRPSPTKIAVFKYQAKLLKLYLARKKKEGKTVFEKDGKTPMVVNV